MTTRKISEIATQASALEVTDRFEVTQEMDTTPVTRYATPDQVTDYVADNLTAAPELVSVNGLNVGAGPSATLDDYNTVLGDNAFAANESCSYSTAIGAFALAASVDTFNNVAVGSFSLPENTDGRDNTAVGDFSCRYNTTGENNTALASGALSRNTTGSENVAVGSYALSQSTTANGNVAIGANALGSSTTGTGLVAVGTNALSLNSTGNRNVAIGNSASAGNTTGVENSALGHAALNGVTVGLKNVGVGFEAGSSITTGERNTIIGSDSTASANSGIDQTVVGHGLTGKGNDTAFIGGTNGAYNEKNVTTWETTSDARIKKDISDNHDGLSKIQAIRVRNFAYRAAEEIVDVPPHAAVARDGVQIGVIAQEFLPECVTEASTGVLSVNTDAVLWYLVNAVKELAERLDAATEQSPSTEGAA
jgi:hypothetical protein